MSVKKSKTTEEQYEMFLKMLKKDKEKVPELIKFIERMVYDTMKLGERGYQPVFAITLFAKQIDDKLEVIMRPVRTPDTNTYETFQFEKLGEWINEAFYKYGKEIWGMTPIHEKEQARIAGDKAMSQWGHLASTYSNFEFCDCCQCVAEEGVKCNCCKCIQLRE